MGKTGNSTKTKERVIPPDVVFEDTSVGRLERGIWLASDEEIDRVLGEYGIPSPSELGNPHSYIQTAPGHIKRKVRSRNDVVLIPIGSTENHGDALPSGADTLFVAQICEAVRRVTAKQGREVALAWPVTYGAHPWHHYGIPGNVIIDEDTLKQHTLEIMLGLWNDGFRKQILVNNHGHFWVFESAVQVFMKKFQLPGLYLATDWHKTARKFFRTKDRGGEFETDFIHADEAEVSIARLLVPDMVDMEYAVDTEPRGYLPDGHMDKAVDGLGRPHRWSEGQGHMPIEIVATPEAVVGKATLADADKPKRAVAYFMEYLTLLIDQWLETFPPGEVPPVEETTFRTKQEMEPCLKEPGSPGWKPIYGLTRRLGD